MEDSQRTILSVKDLRVSMDTYDGELQAVRGVSFEIKEGEALVIVGESGCGKSVTAQSILRLNPEPPARIKSGEISLDGIDIIQADEKKMQQIRGSLAGMIFQDPMTSLNPTMTVGRQIGETLEIHQKVKKHGRLQMAVDLLSAVRIPGAAERVKQYPGAFSGGMRQRALIAAAIACKPKLLIADEPTTALDVTIQAQIIDLLRSIQKSNGMSILLITHDLAVAASIAQRIAVMYAGKIVEIGSAREIFHHPKHPYTWGLMNSIPSPDQDQNSELQTIGGTPPRLVNPSPGCGFAPRCPYAMRICLETEPEQQEVAGDHQCACWLLHPGAPKVERAAKEGILIAG
ncbi:ABC transporter ATP-binding protein [Paenibacillus sp. P46E]|uniref:ABC transporter ATP-binding protein n=1 Tax=Paenibacillus sp. P46E TaxID=1349436 RepID=UPI0009395A96|nr:ABC transporter ATP-binding protein [Paenibacillus sp. P46E]OKP95161.1 peptide ABC transporter ATP-binding protein [Paenibacillus sp. P46E]